MKVTPIPLTGAFLVDRPVTIDHRGLFERLFCARDFASMGLNKPIVQVNHSATVKTGTIRGLHFQYPPNAEGKLVTCIRGSVFDVMVDLRKGSSSFLGWHGEVLSAENHRLLFIPEGFAHGFQTLMDHSELIYFHTEFYARDSEGGIRFDDPRLGITWKMPCADISDRDQNHPLLKSDFEGLEI